MSALLSGKTVLIADDEQDLLEIMSDEFRLAGATVVCANSGNQALRLLENTKVDAIVSDMRMPDGNGMDLLLGLKQKGISLPVFIFITGFSNIELDEAYRAGALAVFSKPCDFLELVKKVALELGK